MPCFVGDDVIYVNHQMNKKIENFHFPVSILFILLLIILNIFENT